MEKKPFYYTEEYIVINEIPQYLLHIPALPEKPVILFIHGGPGMAESLLAHEIEKYSNGSYTMVHYDQRGAGKTLSRNKDSIPTAKLLLSDLLEIVKYIKTKYKKDKIVLLGHSWGSVLGTTFVRKLSQHISAYIGTGQVIDFFENETIAYEQLKSEILVKDNKMDFKKLDKIGKYPEKKFDETMMKKLKKIRKLQMKYKLADGISFHTIKIALKSPIFGFSDFISMLKAEKVNQKVFTFLTSYSLYSSSLHYKIPMFFIMGEKDQQTPHTIAKKYFETIEAPLKKYYSVPDAGHMVMIDQPEKYHEIMDEIIEVVEGEACKEI